MFTKKPLSTLTGSCLIAAAAALQVPAASALPINITSIISSWTDAVTNPADGATGIGTNAISWGIPATDDGQSGYIFAPAGVPINGVNPDVDFELGTFTHNNFPIFAPSLTTAELTVQISFDVLEDGMVIGDRTINSVFDFTHLESPNAADPCADGNAQGVPPNQNGCADRVTFESSASSETFALGDFIYTFNLSGFAEGLGEPPVGEFWTVEEQANSAVLIANYTIAEPMPLPGAGLLLLTGLAGVGVARRAGRASKA